MGLRAMMMMMMMMLLMWPVDNGDADEAGDDGGLAMALGESSALVVGGPLLEDTYLRR
jgi:hypothetical protein